MTTQAQKNARNKYNKKNIKVFSIALSIISDSDIIAHLSALDNKNGYIKELIRRDISRTGGK